MSFTDHTAKTLITTVTPSDCNERVTWETSSISVATVKNGVITPRGNGDCTITVTCGSYSATCNVTVSGLTKGDISQLSNVVSYYDASTLTTGATTWTDSVNSHTLSINGPTVNDGMLSFDGTNDYCLGSLNLSSYTSFTLALDIRNSVRTGNNVESFAIIGQITDTNLTPIIKYGKGWNSYCSVGIQTEYTATVPTEYDKAILVKNGTNLRLYINGTMIGNVTYETGTNDYTLKVGCGKYNGSLCDYANFSTSKIIVMGSAATDEELTIINNIL